MNFMSKEEALEFFNGIKINFEEYSKKTFSFSGEKDGSRVLVRFNCLSDIYSDNFSSIEIFNKNMDVEYFTTGISGGSDKENKGKPLYIFEEEL